MSLLFRIEATKQRGARIAVIREYIDNGETKKTQIGSITKKNYPALLLDKLTEEEQYELENFLSTLNFSKTYFGNEVEELDRFIIKVSPKFKTALYELWRQAKTHGMDFVPEEEMLYALLDKAKLIERTLNKISTTEINILKKYNINPEGYDDRFVAEEGQKLFHAILRLDISLEDISQEFGEIAKETYKKNTVFKPHYFKYYAELTTSENRKPFPKWYYAVAMDLLQKHNVNPLKIIFPTTAAKYWGKANLENHTSSELTKTFLQKFQPAENQKDKCLNILLCLYKQDII